LWNEDPVAGASVYATSQYDFSSEHYGSAVTDVRGGFAIVGVPTGNKYLYVFGNRPEFWVSAVTPITMVAGAGTAAADTYLCKGFTPVAPRDGETVTTGRPLLRWDPYPSAIDYAARVIRVADNQIVFSRGDFDARVKETSIQVTVTLIPGDYRWRVDAFNVGGHIIGCSNYPSSFSVR